MVSRWSKHGLTSLHIPGHDPPLDITVFMDVSPNPGPGILTNRTCSSRSCTDLHMTSCQDSTITYSRNQLFRIRRTSICPRVLPESIYTKLKNSGLYHYRGNRAGQQSYHRNIQVTTFDQCLFNIPTVISHHRSRLRTDSRTADFSNLSYLRPMRRFNHGDHKVRFAVWNAQSINNKSSIICDIILSNHFAVTETWLSSDSNTSIAGILNTLNDFIVWQVPRVTGRGGGIAFFARKVFTITNEANTVFKSFEYTDLFVKYKRFDARFVVIYRPPPSKKNNLTSAIFLEEFSRFCEQLTLDGRPLIICGDFNYHIDNSSNSEARQFIDLLESANLFQHVSGSTHRRGHTLDLIITRKDESLIKEVDILHDIYSDHRVVTCKLNFAKPPRSKILVACRNNKTFDSDGFRLGLTDALSQLILDQDISVDTYNASLAKVYNAHFPLQTRWVTHRPCCAWYTSDLRAMKREKHQAERKFRKSRLEVHKQLFEASCATYNSLLESTKFSYYTQKIESSNTKQPFRMIDGFFTAKITSITDT